MMASSMRSSNGFCSTGNGMRCTKLAASADATSLVLKTARLTVRARRHEAHGIPLEKLTRQSTPAATTMAKHEEHADGEALMRAKRSGPHLLVHRHCAGIAEAGASR